MFKYLNYDIFILVIKMKEKEFDLKFYRRIKSILNVFMKIAFNPEIIGNENVQNESGLILAGNHKSFLDIPLVISAVSENIHFMAKKELFDAELAKYVFSKMGAFPVNRDGIDISAIKTAMKILKDEEILGIFPEGTRNKTDAILLPFKEGTTRIAIKTKKPIIPFGISGKYRLGGGITIKFGEAIDFNTLNVKNQNEYLRDKIKELIK